MRQKGLKVIFVRGFLYKFDIYLIYVVETSHFGAVLIYWHTAYFVLQNNCMPSDYRTVLSGKFVVGM